jgi:hypothetical protein
MCIVLSLIMLVCGWLLNDWEFRTKLIMTGFFALSFLLLFVDAWAFAVGQAIFSLVVGAFTFAGRMRR